jgi:tRNA pseudouridine55 synthase
MDGIILVNKESGMTSRDVVNKISHIFNTKKVGHTGTLDPMATGVLAIGIGKALKVLEYITALEKEYEAEITIGINTDTLDITGKVLETKDVNITNDEIDKVLDSFIGDYDMEVPKYSAVRVNGKRLYEYARNNEEVELPIHKVKIYSLERTSDIKDNKFTIKCKVSKGTYIRSLVRDISSRLNTVGVMSKLNRTSQGKFNIEDSYTLDDIEEGNYKLIDIVDAIDLPKVEIDENLLKKISNGVKLKDDFNLDIFCFTHNNQIIAIYRKVDGMVKPVKVFNN